MSTRPNKLRGAAVAAKAPADDKEPRRWWQWVLLYPALVIALLTALPQWVDMGLAAYHKTRGPSFAKAKQQQDMWQRNLSCSASPFRWYKNPRNVRVDATICDSGDIFVRVSTPENKQFYEWVSLDEVVSDPGGPSIIAAAHAALPRFGAAERRGVQLAQLQAAVLCQRFLNQRMLLRRVRTPQGCFDEVVDTLNGTVVQRNGAPCTPQC